MESKRENPKREKDGTEGSPLKGKARIGGEELTVYFRGRQNAESNDTEGDWYSVAVDDEREIVCEKLPHRQPNVAEGTFCEAVGSVIYDFGGLVMEKDGNGEFQVNLGRDMWCLDTKSAEQKWFRRSSMKSARWNCNGGQTAVIGGKIYVIGGLKPEEEGVPGIPWGEMYDPDLDTWSSLPEPNPNTKELKSASGFDPNTQILSVVNDCLGCFDVTDRSWALIRREKLNSFYWLGNIVVDDQILYCFDGTSVTAIGLLDGSIRGKVQGLKGCIPDYNNFQCRYPIGCLVPLSSKKFAIIWSDNLKANDDNFKAKDLGEGCFVIFTVNKVVQPDGMCHFYAHVLGNNSIHIDKESYDLDASCVIVIFPTFSC